MRLLFPRELKRTFDSSSTGSTKARLSRPPSTISFADLSSAAGRFYFPRLVIYPHFLLSLYSAVLTLNETGPTRHFRPFHRPGPSRPRRHQALEDVDRTNSRVQGTMVTS
jgi:hypothetical protein